MQLTGTAIISSGRACFWIASLSALCRGAQCDSSHEGANLPEFVAKFWESRFPNQLPKGLVVAQELRTNAIELEGEKRTTSLHVP